MKVLVVDWVLTLPKATKIVRFFQKKKKQAQLGYFFELEELPCQIWNLGQFEKLIPNFNETMLYEGHKRLTKVTEHSTAFRLRVYREITVNRTPEHGLENEALRL